MSDKKRRDITLGEMQDECKRRGGLCEGSNFGLCDYSAICKEMHHNGVAMSWKSPLRWGLSDPPRFNEAQMAVFNALHLNGVKEIKISYFGEAYSFALLDKDGSRVSFKQIFGTEEDIDLAELLGKDGAHEKT